MTKSESIYSSRYDFSRFTEAPKKTIMIAATPRSGSTILGLDLWRTGCFGAPLEYINLARRSDMLPRLGNISFGEYWSETQALRTSPNGVFAFKAFPRDFVDLEKLFPNSFKDISSDYVIHLRRDDKVAQAISLAKAIQTEQWYSIVQTNNQSSFNRKYISKLMDHIEREEVSWRILFEKTQTVALEISYEEYLHNKSEIIKSIFNFCKIDICDNHSEINDLLPKLRIQRNEESDDWKKRFISND